MQILVTGKVALVTGGGQGVGKAVALELARSGAAGVCVVARHEDEGRATVAELEALGARATCAVADLADDDAPERAVARCLDSFGRVDCLVNAAGRTDRASLEDATLATWDLLFRINARAPAFLMQRCIAAMKAAGKGSGSGGSIVNILSVNIHCGAPDLAIYTATKAALAVLTKNTANAHRFDRIRVNGITMGWAATPGEMKMQAETLGKGPGWLDAAQSAQPFGRLLDADDVARLTTFLLSDASIPMTGSLIDQEQWVAGSRG